MSSNVTYDTFHDQMRDHDVVIVGAGPAGISTALSLSDLGIRPLLIDRANEVAASWRSRYDRLKLNTGRAFSHLPGRPYPEGTPAFPTRDQVVEHFDRHAREDGIELRLGVEVERIDPTEQGWRLTTSTGELRARQVVVANGYQHTPFIPNWRGTFAGELLHSSSYRNPAPFAGKRVLVVGSGSSGMEIAHDVSAAAAKVWLSVRTPPNIVPRAGVFGLPQDVLSIPMFRLPPSLADRICAALRLRAFGDLSDYGLPIPSEGPFARAHRLHTSPTIVDQDVVDAVRDGSVEIVSGVTALDGDDVVLDDGTRVAPDVVICATGYRPGLDRLVGHLGVLTPEGAPVTHSPEAAADGLYFHGIVSRPGLIGYVARRSRKLANNVAKSWSKQVVSHSV